MFATTCPHLAWSCQRGSSKPTFVADVNEAERYAHIVVHAHIAWKDLGLIPTWSPKSGDEYRIQNLQFSANISLYLRKDTRQKRTYYGMLIRSHI